MGTHWGSVSQWDSNTLEHRTDLIDRLSYRRMGMVFQLHRVRNLYQKLIYSFLEGMEQALH